MRHFNWQLHCVICIKSNLIHWHCSFTPYSTKFQYLMHIITEDKWRFMKFRLACWSHDLGSCILKVKLSSFCDIGNSGDQVIKAGPNWIHASADLPTIPITVMLHKTKIIMLGYHASHIFHQSEEFFGLNSIGLVPWLAFGCRKVIVCLLVSTDCETRAARQTMNCTTPPLYISIQSNIYSVS